MTTDKQALHIMAQTKRAIKLGLIDRLCRLLRERIGARKQEAEKGNLARISRKGVAQ